MVFTGLAMLATLGRFGTDNLALRLLGGDTDSPRSDILQLIVIASIAGAVASIIGYFAIAAYVGQVVSVGVMVLVSSSVFAQALAVVAGTVLRGLGNLAMGVFAELGSLPAIATIVIAGSDVFLPEGIAIDGALSALALAAWITAAWAVPLVVWRTAEQFPDEDHVRPRRGARFFLAHWRKLVPMMGTSLLAYGVVWAPIFVLSATSSAADVSFYSVALRMANMVALLPAIQVSYLAPDFARRFYAGDRAGLNALTARSTVQVVAITAVPVLALVVFAEPIIGLLYGADFHPAAPTLVILSIGVFIVMLCGQVNQLMLLCGLELVSLGLSSLSLMLWATVGVWTSAVHGLLGAAWAGGSISVLYAVMASMFLARMKGIRSYAWPACAR